MKKKNEKITMGLSTKQIKSLLFHHLASFPGQKKTEKERKKQEIKLKQEKTGLPTKRNKCLLLHYQPSFPGEKTKKVMHVTKKTGLPTKRSKCLP